MLRVNPDFYSLWNFRREILQSIHTSMFEEANASQLTNTRCISTDVGGAVRDAELSLTVDCIRKNPKSYGAWYHRQWVLMHFEADVPQEFNLCSQFLAIDERNFHCWNYRRWVADTFVQDDTARIQQELEFSTDKINQNFSNYSAFHHRSCYIKRCSQDADEALKQEFDLVQNALFTEPDDQSAWWYYSFLITWARQIADGGKDMWLETLVDEQTDVLQSLLEVEETNKWARVTLVRLLEVKAHVKRRAAQDFSNVVEQRRVLLEELSQIDPAHHHRYQYLLAIPIA